MQPTSILSKPPRFLHANRTSFMIKISPKMTQPLTKARNNQSETEEENRSNREPQETMIKRNRENPGDGRRRRCDRIIPSWRQKPAKKCCENHHFPESKARTLRRLNWNNPVMGTSRRKLPF
ncbi:hypothetical protein F2Q69_00028116 [Brassica cretica]|uniref:Uncharacterized protein n=2 Tax=Brassica TaxID=3705 RepID=A0A8S9S5S9_BRACR|nr:hypothetical protein F2Q69_00028116 [Brassica cretica]